MNITIIGCGHGGQALAAHLSLARHRVTLYADEAHPGFIDGICNNTITLKGKIDGEATIAHLTKDIAAALADAEVIYLSLPTNAHLDQFRKMLPWLKSGQMVITLAGNFSGLYFYRELVLTGRKDDIYLADIASLPYACRTLYAGKIDVIDIKRSVDIAAMPSKHTGIIVNKICGHFPSELTVSESLLESGLNITSAISHPAIMLMNAGRIGEGEDEFYFYKQGISREIANIIEQLDNERRKIGRLLGFSLPGYLDIMEKFYAVKHASYYDFFTQSRVHNQQKLCPTAVSNRYLSQDVPYVMVPWHSLGLHLGYESTVMRSIIDLTSVLNNSCYYRNGRLLSEDFFCHMSSSDITQYMKTGD
ncbi:NAD/NADP-dependent octopine/nopaline dehydrogenase family protein [Winslowiella toletana]|uniref:NAD/NADP-dependent octopine/nopaline dehydrogenase family protein n=1 Tax=Winslowiella toletana TaxID=92490 RepID=UPI0028BEAF36|nr:NAD/NADP octopine/nopaline dehydrogenase family protein [Winslowiella toletana]WNN46373.1 NAD/NADP octopine/nopaline dehydrogenase family protein [Winslowiella toletana]